ncbi:MAG: hypothetical protein ABIL05_01595 [candidate division WOR-3 bacterium]
MLIISLSFGQKKSPTKAMLFCLFPGGGQFYTHRYIRGSIIGSGEVALGYFAYQFHTGDRYIERNSMLWYLTFLFGYSLADAYVGAKMFNFKAECDLNKTQAKASIGVNYLW